MLSETERLATGRLVEYDSRYRAVLRKRILDKAEASIEDLLLILENNHDFPTLAERITPNKVEQLVDAYFHAFKTEAIYTDPRKVIDLINENVMLHRKNAKLEERIGDMIHEVEHFKYLACHTTRLLEKERNGKIGDCTMTAP